MKEKTRLSELETDMSGVLYDDVRVNEWDLTGNIIIPIVRDVLGWEDTGLGPSSEVGFQSSADRYDSDGNVDLVLDKGDTECFIEVKRPGKNIDREKFVNQLKSYVESEDADWGLLTNGIRFKIYNNSNHQFKLVDECSFLNNSTSEIYDTISILSKSNIKKNYSRKIKKSKRTSIKNNEYEVYLEINNSETHVIHSSDQVVCLKRLAKFLIENDYFNKGDKPIKKDGTVLLRYNNPNNSKKLKNIKDNFYLKENKSNRKRKRNRMKSMVSRYDIDIKFNDKWKK